ncbi:MAG: HAD hydrolase-like protein [Proteobacteria bacterium]|nr:HAD hydrolase-like protein [Pseudomonadota bacterium]
MTTTSVVFDLDETLVDRTESINSYLSTLWPQQARVEMELTEFIEAFHRLDGNGRRPRDPLFQTFATKHLTDLSPDEFRQHFYANVWLEPLLFDGVEEALRRLCNAHIRIGVVSNGGAVSQTAKITSSGSAWFVGDDPLCDVVGPHKVGFRTAWLEKRQPWPQDLPCCYTMKCLSVEEFVIDLLGPS